MSSALFLRKLKAYKMKNKIYNFYLKPTLLRGWVLVRETPKCYVVRKVIKKDDCFQKKGDLGDEYHLSKKYVLIKRVMKSERPK